MASPRCLCGYETKSGFRPIKRAPRPEDPAIAVEVESRSSDTDTAKWRSQLDKKFESSRETVEDIVDFQNRVDQLFAKRQHADADGEMRMPGHLEASDVDVAGPSLKQTSPDVEEPVVPTASEVPLPIELEESIVAGSVRPVAGRQAEQKTLTLEPLAGEVTRAKPGSAEKREAKRSVSREMIFSRILAGIVDLLLPVVIAVFFVFAASWFLKFDFFSSASTQAWVALALVLYFLNSFYFFWTAGQTPGMHLTELQLVSQDDEEPAWGAVLLRVIVFLPILLTVVGLVLALFDSQCRALHDRLSGTKVVPAKAA